MEQNLQCEVNILSASQ